MIDSEAERLSSGDEIASDTDVEQYISSEDWSLKEYHLGDKYFDFAIAKQLLELPDLGNNWQELNSRMERFKREFPFKETLVTIQEQCPKNLWRQGCDDHEELMATLGAILRDGKPKFHAFAEELLKKGSHDSLNLPRRKDSFSFVFPKPDPQPQIVASGKDVSAIKEFGDRIGEIPQYRAVSVSEYPPCFEAVLQFNGSKFVGRGGSKPKARQEAAFKACRKFVDSMRQ